MESEHCRLSYIKLRNNSLKFIKIKLEEKNECNI